MYPPSVHLEEVATCRDRRAGWCDIAARSPAARSRGCLSAQRAVDPPRPPRGPGGVHQHCRAAHGGASPPRRRFVTDPDCVVHLGRDDVCCGVRISWPPRLGPVARRLRIPRPACPPIPGESEYSLGLVEPVSCSGRPPGASGQGQGWWSPAGSGDPPSVRREYSPSRISQAWAGGPFIHGISAPGAARSACPLSNRMSGCQGAPSASGQLMWGHCAQQRSRARSGTRAPGAASKYSRYGNRRGTAWSEGRRRSARKVALFGQNDR